MPPIFSRSKQRSNQDDRNGRSVIAQNQSVPLPQEASARSGEASQSSQSRRSTFCTRLVKVDDDELAAMALGTKHSIDWRAVMLSARVGPARWRRVDTIGDFAVYTRQESQRFAVLAVGLVPGCVSEIVNALQSPNNAQHAQQMEGIFGDQFREGSFVHRAEVDSKSSGCPPSARAAKTSDGADASLAELSVKTVTFQKTGWFSHHEEWCYLDSVYRHGNGKGGKSGVVEKFMTTMQPKDIIAGLSGSRAKYFHDVVCGYLLRPGAEDPPVSDSNQQDANESQRAPNVTRVTFYAEFNAPRHFTFSLGSHSARSMAASEKTIKQRLLKLAESTARLIALVRRQRLGVQVLVDGSRFLPPINTPCKVCTKVLMVAKQCRLCGHAVCGDCSAKHERARQPRQSPTLEVAEIRVCATCMERVDLAEYTYLSQSSLLGTHIVPDPEGAKPADVVLKDLLQDALLSAPSPSRRACVVNVIKCVLDQENDELRSHNASFASASSFSTATPSGSDCREYLHAMEDMAIEPVSAETARLRSDDHRIYQMDSRGLAAVPTPVPESEVARLRAVQRVDIAELSGSAELEIICDVAAKEMGCMTSVISIIDCDTYHVVASNAVELQNAKLPRNTSMCSHTIMENSPMMVTHPEADIRFSRFDSVKAFGVRYYCAFPLLGDDDQIIGAMCCINSESIEITESQFAAFKKLTSTAAKVVRIQNSKQLRKASTASSTTVSSDGGACPVASSA